MTKVVYEVVEHDGGWAYCMDGAFSESFPSHDHALEAARVAAQSQQQRSEADQIYEQPDELVPQEPLELEILDRNLSAT